MAGAHLNKDFFEFTKAIGESRSKQEEDRIVKGAITELKKLLTDRTMTGKRLKEFLIRLIYVEMLGHDASFGYMKAVELSATPNLLEKRVAYLCAGLCFAPGHEFRMMLVNRMQRDLQSANVLEITMALGAATRILTPDMIPAVLPIVVNLLKHDQDIVRKKAVMCLHRFLQLQADSVSHLADAFRRTLCDKDPAVMGASLYVFYDMAKADPSAFKDLVSSFVSILKQVIEHRLPRDFDYHRVPAPWIQIMLLRLLAILGRADQAASEQMYEVLLDVIRRADTGNNAGYAIIYESVRTVTTIYPNTTLLDAAAAAIGRFITSDNHNLKYLGVTGLAAIVRDHPRYAAEHQLAVIDCLEDPDETLKRKTLELLYRMTNPVNVVFIVDKLMGHLRAAVDPFLRGDLVTSITGAAERYAPSNSWYIATMTAVLEAGGDLVRPATAYNLVRLIAEGTGESPEADAELRRIAVETFLESASKPALPDMLLQCLFWVLGEYGYLSTTASLGEIADKVCSLAQRSGLDVTTRAFAIGAAMKLTAQLGGALVPSAAALVSKFSSSRHVVLAELCYEMVALASPARVGLMKHVLPADASTEDIAVDTGMGFLDGFVAEALSAGARSYAPPKAEDEDAAARARSGSKDVAGGLRFDAYAKPELPVAGSRMSMAAGGGIAALVEGMAAGGGAAGGIPGADPYGVPSAAAPAPATLNLSNVKGAWGKEGYKASSSAAAAAAPAPAPAGPPLDASGKRPWDAMPLGAAPATPYGAPATPTTPMASFTSPVAPAPAPEPPKPRELTEKEKAAAMLFGGIVPGGGGASAGAAASAAAAARPRPGFGAPAPAPVPVPVPAPAPAASSSVDDLLGLGFYSAPAPAPAAPAPAASAGLDMFGFAAPVPAAARPASVAAAVADPFGGAFGGLSIAGSGAAPAAVDVSAVEVPAALAATLGPAVTACPRRAPAAGNAVLASVPGGVSVGLRRVWADNGLHLLFFVANNGPVALAPGHSFTLSPLPFTAPTVKAVGAGPGAGVATASGAGGVTAPLGLLAPQAVACVAVTLALAALPAGVTTVRGAVGSSASFAFDLTVCDFLRPLATMDTPAFGGMWTSAPFSAPGCETVAAVAGAGVRSLQELMGRLGGALNLHPIQAIPATNEAIAAAKVLGTTANVLVHCRLLPTGGVEARIKTPDAGLTAATSSAVAAKLLP